MNLTRKKLLDIILHVIPGKYCFPNKSPVEESNKKKTSGIGKPSTYRDEMRVEIVSIAEIIAYVIILISACLVILFASDILPQLFR